MKKEREMRDSLVGTMAGMSTIGIIALLSAIRDGVDFGMLLALALMYLLYLTCLYKIIKYRYEIEDLYDKVGDLETALDEKIKNEDSMVTEFNVKLKKLKNLSELNENIQRLDVVSEEIQDSIVEIYDILEKMKKKKRTPAKDA